MWFLLQPLRSKPDFLSKLSLPSTLDGVSCQRHATPRPLYPRERGPVPILHEAGLAPGMVCTGAEKLAPTWIRPPERLALSESLYRLSYPDPRERIKP